MEPDRAKHAVLPISKFGIDADHPAADEAGNEYQYAGSLSQAAMEQEKFFYAYCWKMKLKRT